MSACRLWLTGDVWMIPAASRNAHVPKELLSWTARAVSVQQRDDCRPMDLPSTSAMDCNQVGMSAAAAAAAGPASALRPAICGNFHQSYELCEIIGRYNLQLLPLAVRTLALISISTAACSVDAARKSHSRIGSTRPQTRCYWERTETTPIQWTIRPAAFQWSIQRGA